MSGEQTYLQVYPNPANAWVHIKVPGRTILRISVFNDAGQQVMQCSETSFSVAELPSGLYTIWAETDDGRRQYRLVKQ
jgi:hypothetical protein